MMAFPRTDSCCWPCPSAPRPRSSPRWRRTPSSSSTGRRASSTSAARASPGASPRAWPPRATRATPTSWSRCSATRSVAGVVVALPRPARGGAAQPAPQLDLTFDEFARLTSTGETDAPTPRGRPGQFLTIDDVVEVDRVLAVERPDAWEPWFSDRIGTRSRSGAATCRRRPTPSWRTPRAPHWSTSSPPSTTCGPGCRTPATGRAPAGPGSSYHRDPADGTGSEAVVELRDVLGVDLADPVAGARGVVVAPGPAGAGVAVRELDRRQVEPRWRVAMSSARCSVRPMKSARWSSSTR